MKQLLILSGKGGTGKTTIASAFIKLGKVKAYADCDVDAPNLHLVTQQVSQAKLKDYYGMDKAYINNDICTECDLCREHCRFDAIKLNGKYVVDIYACEGCGLCQEICPVKAVDMERHKAGDLILYKDVEVFSTAQLKMGSGNSGLLVTEVKNTLKREVEDAEIAIIDGSPGIGCPVIASISGVDMVLIVAEPSISGINDMERIIETSKGFGTKIGVCVNKFDINIEKTEKIKEYCQKNRIDFLGLIPFDKAAVKVINKGKSIVDIDCKAGNASKDVFRRTMDLLKK